MKIRVLDPRASSEGEDLRLAPPLKSLAGTVVGMIDNGKIGTEKFFDYVASLLTEQHGVREFLRVRKPDATKPVPPAMLASIGGADAILAAMGD